MKAACFYVYVLFRPWDGSPCYVGKGKGDRWRDHERPSEGHPNRHLSSIVKKAARLGLEIPKVKVRENLTEAEAFAIEKALIAAMRRGPNGPLVNLTDGGEGASGFVRPQEWRARMSRIMTGKPGPMKGRKHSAETRAKMSRAQQRRSPEINSKCGNGKRGRKLTPAHRMKLRLAKLGKRLSVEHRARIAQGNLGKKRTPEVRERMRRAMRRDPISGRWLHGTSTKVTEAESAYC
jgi:hypothetical protein